jgi:four helix bundle protein
MNEEDLISEEPISSYDKNKDFDSLRCWQKCRLVKLFFYNEIVPKLPKYEMNNLTNQIRRSSVSITANIAEGYGRYYFQEGIQFYRISRGSLYELKDHLISCLDLKFIEKETYEEGINLIEEAKINLNGYIKFVIKQKSSTKK